MTLFAHKTLLDKHDRHVGTSHSFVKSETVPFFFLSLFYSRSVGVSSVKFGITRYLPKYARFFSYVRSRRFTVSALGLLWHGEADRGGETRAPGRLLPSYGKRAEFNLSSGPPRGETRRLRVLRARIRQPFRILERGRFRTSKTRFGRRVWLHSYVIKLLCA